MVEIDLDKITAGSFGNPLSIIDNPPISVQLAFVRAYPASIFYIKNPPIEVQIESARLRMGRIEPSPLEVQLLAIRENLNSIESIVNPFTETTKAFLNAEKAFQDFNEAMLDRPPSVVVG